jgi:hypothetical protein
MRVGHSGGGAGREAAVKGIIFNLVEEVVTEDYGADSWDDLLESTPVSGAYTSVATYSDSELDVIVDAAAAMTGLTPGQLLRYVGRRSLPLLRDRYPEFFQMHTTTRTYLHSLNEVVHPEVRKLYEGAEPPRFSFTEQPDGDLLMAYHSRRNLCLLGEGLVLGASDVYHENISVTQPECKLDGAPHCIMRISWT